MATMPCHELLQPALVACGIFGHRPFPDGAPVLLELVEAAAHGVATQVGVPVDDAWLPATASVAAVWSTHSGWRRRTRVGVVPGSCGRGRTCPRSQ